ncbi:MAG: hypothetical protein AAB592_05615 [Patescibacteria group bacterium]
MGIREGPSFYENRTNARKALAAAMVITSGCAAIRESVNNIDTQINCESRQQIDGDGWRYEGETCHDQPHGAGRIEWDSGAFYYGEFREGKIDGHGFYVREDQGRFEGNFSNNQPPLYGRIRWPDGSEYEGGLPFKGECDGRMNYPGGTHYVGTFLDGKPHGNGKVVLSDAGWYDGVFYMGNPPNSVVINWHDGRRFEGRISFDFYKGKSSGTMVFRDGGKHKGQFLNGKPHGDIVVALHNGGSYMGEFSHGKPPDSVVITWPDGRRYEGHNPDVYSRYNGTLLFANGKKFEGTFENDEPTIGQWTDPDEAPGKSQIEAENMIELAFPKKPEQPPLATKSPGTTESSLHRDTRKLTSRKKCDGITVITEDIVQGSQQREWYDTKVNKTIGGYRLVTRHNVRTDWDSSATVLLKIRNQNSRTVGVTTRFRIAYRTAILSVLAQLAQDSGIFVSDDVIKTAKFRVPPDAKQIYPVTIDTRTLYSNKEIVGVRNIRIECE